MTSDKIRKNFFWERSAVYGVMLFFLIAAQVLIPKNNWQEVFPFFHWSLFSSIDSQFNFMQIKLVTQNKDGSATECYLQDCENVDSRLRSKSFFFLLQDVAGTLKKETAVSVDAKERVAQLEQQLKRFGFVGSYQLIDSSVVVDSFGANKKTTENNIVYSGIVK